MTGKLEVDKTLDKSLLLFCAQQPTSSRISPVHIPPSVSLKSISLYFQLRRGLLIIFRSSVSDHNLIRTQLFHSCYMPCPNHPHFFIIILKILCTSSEGYRKKQKWVPLLTAKSAVDLGRDMRWRKQTAFCMWPVTNIFQLQIHWAEVHSCFVRVR
jgi:hypothetical protein